MYPAELRARERVTRQLSLYGNVCSSLARIWRLCGVRNKCSIPQQKG